jgi:hypothetical protein
MATFHQVAGVLEAPADHNGRRVHWSTFRISLSLTIGLRIFYSVVGALFSRSLRLDPALIQTNGLTGNLISRDAHPVLYAIFGIWERFDTLWYIRIANHGYDRPIPTVFYPLYPALIRTVSTVTRYDLASALAISTASVFFLVWGALRLFEADYPKREAFGGVMLWLAWPASFTLFAAYPDSLMCAAIVWAVYFAREKRWLSAGIAGFLAGCTKAVGCLTALPVLWLAWKARDWRGAVASALCLAGTVTFQAWLALRHFPPATATYALYWHTGTAAPWVTLMEAMRGVIHGGDFLLLLNFGALLVAGGFALLPGVRFEYKLFTVAAISLFLTKHSHPLLESTTRYSLALFATFPSLAARVPAPLIALPAFALNLLLFCVFLDWGLVV